MRRHLVYLLLILWPISASAAETPPVSIPLQIDSIAVQYKPPRRRIQKAYVTIMPELTNPDDVKKVCDKLRTINQVIAIAIERIKRKKKTYTLKFVANSIGPEIRKAFPKIKFNKIFVLQGHRPLGMGSEFTEMPGINPRCKSLTRFPLDILALFRKPAKSKLDFNPRVMRGGKYPIVLNRTGIGALIEDDSMPSWVFFTLIGGGVLAVGGGGGIIFESRRRRNQKAPGDRRDRQDRRKSSAGPPDGVERRKSNRRGAPPPAEDGKPKERRADERRGEKDDRREGKEDRRSDKKRRRKSDRREKDDKK